MNSSEAAQAKKWRKQGLCWQCGMVKTHQGLLRRKLTIEHQVYKGICLHCNSYTQAKLQLNEQVERYGIEYGEDNRSPMTPIECGSWEGPDHGVVPALVRTLTRGRDDISTLTLDTELLSDEVTRNLCDATLGRIPEVHSDNGHFDSHDIRSISQEELERSRTDYAQTGREYSRLVSFQTETERSNSQSLTDPKELAVHRRASSGSSGGNTGSTSAVSDYNTLLARKLTVGSGNIINQAPLASTSYEFQPDGGSTEHERNNLTSQTKQEPKSRIEPMAEESRYEILLRRKMATSSGCVNTHSDKQTPTSPIPAETDRVTHDDGDSIMTAMRLQEERIKNSQRSISSLRSGSIQQVQGLSSSEQNNSVSQNMNVGQERNNDSLDEKSKIGPMAVGSEYGSLLAKKIAGASGTDANSVSQANRTSISTEAHTESDRSIFNRSQRQLERSISPGGVVQSSGDSSQRNARFVQLDQDRNTSQNNYIASRHMTFGNSDANTDPNLRGVTSVIASENETLLARKLAKAFETGDRINANSAYQAPLSSTTTGAQRKLEGSRLGRPHSELERNDSLSLRDLTRYSIGNNSPMLNNSGLVPGINSSEQNNSVPQNTGGGRRGGGESLDRNIRIGHTADGTAYDSLLARKIAEASVIDHQIYVNSRYQANAEAQAESHYSRLGRSQADLDLNNSLTSSTDGQHNSTEGNSSHRLGSENFSQSKASFVRLDQDSRNTSFVQTGKVNSSDLNLREVPSHVGSKINTLLARKQLAVDSGSTDRATHDDGDSIMTAKKLQEERLKSSRGSMSSVQTGSFQQVQGLSSSQHNNSVSQNMNVGHERNNDILDQNTRMDHMAVGSGNETLWAKKIAEAYATDNQNIDSDVNQAQLFSPPGQTSFSDDRAEINSDDAAEQNGMSRNQTDWTIEPNTQVALVDQTSNNGNTSANCPHKNVNIPGAQREDNSDAYITLYNRKLAGTDLPTTGNDTSQLRHEMKECISEVETRADTSCCNELLDTLKRSLSSQAAVMTSLAKIRDYVRVTHGMTSHDSLDRRRPSKLPFPDDEWAKILMMIMASRSSDTTVLTDLLHTIWSIVTTHPHYVSQLTLNADVTQIINTMEIHIDEEPIQEYGCGIFASIAAASEIHAMRLTGVGNGKVVHRLMAALQFHSQHGSVQTIALRALDRLSLASICNKSPKEHFSKTMGRYVENGLRDPDSSVNAIKTVINTMTHNVANISVQVHGNRLLWSIMDPRFGIIDPDYYDILVVTTLRCIDDAMSTHQQSQALHETAVCLLSKMSWYVTDVIEKDLILLLRLVVEAMKTDAMKMHSNSWIVALHGCQCIANICKRSSSLLRSQPVRDGIPVIVSCMKIFQDNVAIQSEACAALSVLCIHSPPNKDRVNEMDGINRIKHAYDLLITSTTSSHVDKIRACTALTTLAVDPNILGDIEENGIFVKIKALLEQDQTLASELRKAILDLLILAPDEENRKLMLRDGAREEETRDWLRANLRVVAAQDVDSRQINYLRCKTIHGMVKFSKSASIHESGCKLLACLYHQASHDEPFAKGRLIAELEAMCHSLMQHMDSPANVIATCSALQNLSILLSFSTSDDVSGLSDALSKSSAEVAKALFKYSHDVETFVRITGALWALCIVRDSLAMSFDIDCSIVLIVSAMNRFPDSVDLHRHGIGLMGLFFSVSNDVIEYVTDELVSAIMRFVNEEIDNDDAEDLIDTSVDMILTMSNQGFQAVTTLLRHNMLVETVVSCMGSFPDSPSIQCAGIEILNNVSIDSHLRNDVCQRGGMRMIISTLNLLRHDPIVVCKAFKAFANLVKGTGDEILRDLRAPEIFVTAMQLHSQNLYIQTEAINALWTLSARKQTTNASQSVSDLNTMLRIDIVYAGGADVISETMMRFIASKQILLPGFAVLWNLAEPRDLKMRVGRYAINTLANGISAHISSLSIDACKYALGCLKCLSSSPFNRNLLEDHGAADLIYSCMWMHADNSAVCNVAMSALVNVSAYVDRNLVSEIADGDLDSIVNAMRNHQNTKSIQQNALIVLKNLSSCRVNLMVMKQNPFLVPLIHSAKSTWRTNFQGRADDLLRVLPAL